MCILVVNISTKFENFTGGHFVKFIKMLTSYLTDVPTKIRTFICFFFAPQKLKRIKFNMKENLLYLSFLLKSISQFYLILQHESKYFVNEFIYR